MRLHHTDDPICPLCEEKLKGAHEYMAEWFRRVKRSYPNVHTSCAYRGKEEQDAAVARGASRARFPKSAHNFERDGKPCSLALDLFQIDEDGIGRWVPLFFAKINAENEKSGEPLIWGGRFKSIGDSCHFELDRKKRAP